jgi:hypothetical protein
MTCESGSDVMSGSGRAGHGPPDRLAVMEEVDDGPVGAIGGEQLGRRREQPGLVKPGQQQPGHASHDLQPQRRVDHLCHLGGGRGLGRRRLGGRTGAGPGDGQGYRPLRPLRSTAARWLRKAARLAMLMNTASGLPARNSSGVPVMAAAGGLA